MNPVKVLEESFAGEVLAVTHHRGQDTVMVRRERVLDLLRFLKEHPDFEYRFLADIAGTDHLEFPVAPERFGVAYHLHSPIRRDWLRLKAMVPEEDPVIDSAIPLWPAANWLEREVYDLFGIRFRGHPNLVRILTPDDFEGHALRKDFPLKGRGYRERFRKYVLEPPAPPSGAGGPSAGGPSAAKGTP